tara:strand:+ start:169 stop:363 length:195 start_codon:yes stop_codon:yes gene_type:complete
MGVWVEFSSWPTVHCEIPKCVEPAIMVFLPAFESPGGWSGDSQQYDPELNIGYVCGCHYPGDSR